MKQNQQRKPKRSGAKQSKRKVSKTKPAKQSSVKQRKSGTNITQQRDHKDISCKPSEYIYKALMK